MPRFDTRTYVGLGYDLLASSFHSLPPARAACDIAGGLKSPPFQPGVGRAVRIASHKAPTGSGPLKDPR